MNRFLIIVFFATSTPLLNAQSIEKSDIQKYSVEGSSKQVKKAKEYSKEYNLNEKGELVVSVIKEYPGVSKADLWIKIKEWILSSSSNSQSSVQLMDEASSTIIERCYIPEIAKRTMGDNSYKVSIRPQLKFEFKDGKLRFTFSLQNYEVLKRNDDGGYAIMIGGGFGITGNGVTQDNMIWKLTECYPFKECYDEELENDIFRPKVTSSRAFVNTIACYKVLLDQIDEVISKPVNNNDIDW